MEPTIETRGPKGNRAKVLSIWAGRIPGLRSRVNIPGLVLSVLSLFSLSTFGFRGLQTISPRDVDARLAHIEVQHVEMLTKSASMEQHLQYIEKQLEAIQDQRLEARMIHQEDTAETNQWLLRGIFLSVALMAIERMLSYLGILQKKGKPVTP